MVGQESCSLGVEVFMTEEEALWAEWEHGVDSDQWSSSEGVFPLTVPSVRAMSSIEIGSSGHYLADDEVETEDLELVESQRDRQVEVGEVILFVSYSGEGIFVMNPRSKLTRNDLGKLRYLYKICKSVEIQAQRHMKELIGMYPTE